MSTAIEQVTIRAQLIGSPEPRSPEWYQLRREGITATDLPRILGLSSYGNARSVWHDKRGELPEGGQESEAARWGHLLEDVVAQEWALRAGAAVARVGVLAHRDESWMRASCDRLIVGRNAALEVKTRSAFVAGKWRDEIPDDVLAQVAWQRLVGKFDFVEVACLLGGQSLTSERYERDSDLEDLLVEEAAKVWDAVRTGTPPPVDMDGVLLKLLEQLYPDRAGEKEIDFEQARVLLSDHTAAAQAAKDAERRKESAKAAVVSALGEAEVLTLAGEPLFTYREQDKHSISVRDLEDNDVELYEQVLAGGHITTTTSRVLRTGKGAKNV